ncbi:hypothetical protein ACFQVD_09665 [Streptosporangium amethystogenes subsp. fukuiense]|uniref:Uncharacterized protein n=1 Tax=Streptosporangium amethystogenes subsp. fukuiense TaxID=698418 RepID=A0ABW2SW51_9ACTN
MNNSIATSMRYYANANRYPWALAHDRTPVVQAPVGLTFVLRRTFHGRRP